MTIPVSTDYTDKDFTSLNKRLESLLKQVFPTWTDFDRASFGNILKEMFAFSLDVLAYYQDEQAAETRWGTATLRKSIIELAKLINYSLDSASAATVDVVFTLSRAMAGDVVIPSGTYVRTVGSNPIRFHTLASVTIAAGATSSAAVSAKASELQSESFVAHGSASEEFSLSRSPFLDDSQTVTIGGTVWTKVDNFLDSDPTDTHYALSVDDNDLATIRCGDGINGAIPASGSTVAVSYETGGGTEGNVEALSLTRVEGTFTDSLGNAASVSASNALAATGGAARETVEEAREAAPRSLRVLNRTIARTDWEDLAIQYAGIGRALMLTKAEDSTVPDEGYGYLYLVPDSGGTPSAALKTAVETFINDSYPIPLNFSWEARDPAYQTINIDCWVYLSEGYSESDVETSVLAVLRAFFAPVNSDGSKNTAVDFGYYSEDSSGNSYVALSTIANLIHDATGVNRLGTSADGRGLKLNGLEDDVSLALREFPEGGTLTLRNGDTGSTFPGHPISI